MYSEKIAKAAVTVRREEKIHPPVAYVIYTWFHFRAGTGVGFQLANRLQPSPPHGRVQADGLAPLNGLAPQSRLMAQPPDFDLDNFCYTGVVRGRFTCPVYTEPYPDGVRIGFKFSHGESVGDLLEFRLSRDGEYMSARTHLGWINVWCLRNLRGNPTGVRFVAITSTPRAPPPPPPTPAPAA